MILFAEPFEADEPEGSAARGNQYMSRKDLQRIGATLVVMAIICFPVYQHYKREGEKAVCSNNMKAMGQAILAYSIDNDTYLPLAYYPDGQGGAAQYGGFPITWATQVQSGMSKRASFRCPSATSEEETKVVPFSGTSPIILTYGMYAGAAGHAERQYDRPGESVLLSETSNHGANSTLDPSPLGTNDGFLIGLDGTNAQGPDLKTVLDNIKLDLSRNAGDPEKQGLKEPTMVTRLALKGSNSRLDTSSTRHDAGIHVIYIDTRLGLIRGGAARLSSDRYRWAIP